MRCKFRKQASTAIQYQNSGLSYTLTQFRQWVAERTPMATLVVLLGLGQGFWISTEVIAQSSRYPLTEGETKLSTPEIAQDSTKPVDISLERQPDETYETLLSRAEAAASEAVQQSFDQDVQVKDVSVIITAHNQGAIAPVLSLKVNRSEWQSRPDIQSWVTYFTSARSLLQFEDLTTTTPGQSGTANPANRPRQPTNSTSQPGTANPTTTPRQPTNSTSQPGTANPTTTPGQPTNSTPEQPGNANPATTPSQTPQPNTGLNPQSPAPVPVVPASNPLSPTSSPTYEPQNPSAAPSDSGATNNNPFPTPTAPNSIPPGL